MHTTARHREHAETGPMEVQAQRVQTLQSHQVLFSSKRAEIAWKFTKTVLESFRSGERVRRNYTFHMNIAKPTALRTHQKTIVVRHAPSRGRGLHTDGRAVQFLKGVRGAFRCGTPVDNNRPRLRRTPPCVDRPGFTPAFCTTVTRDFWSCARLADT